MGCIEALLTNDADMIENVTFDEKHVGQSAKLMAPNPKVRGPKAHNAPMPLFDPQARLQDLLNMGKGMPAVPCAVVHPCDAESLHGALQAAQHGLIDPILIGPEARIRALAEAEGMDLKGISVRGVEHSHAAADLAAQMAADRQVEAMMKGSLHTDELIHAVLAQPLLRTGRRLSHVFRFDVPAYPKPLLLTDAALNITPSLSEKVDIVQNAIDFAHIMGIALPKVAILAAVETVSAHMPSTIDAAALCKMAQRDQIKGGLLDGPLAFDNAISPESVRIKHIQSNVAGDADILVVPDLESGNMLAKLLEYLAGATTSGLVLGARVPIALTSRADTVNARIASALLVKLVAIHRRQSNA